MSCVSARVDTKPLGKLVGALFGDVFELVQEWLRTVDEAVH